MVKYIFPGLNHFWMMGGPRVPNFDWVFSHGSYVSTDATA